ncbi:hypothetical protein GOP47_0026847 [Adiantum capillus-veneris]|nr:hypothetical protein GOP47_0026847 [Adiantum capillus-veneris]
MRWTVDVDAWVHYAASECIWLSVRARPRHTKLSFIVKWQIKSLCHAVSCEVSSSCLQTSAADRVVTGFADFQPPLSLGYTNLVINLLANTRDEVTTQLYISASKSEPSPRALEALASSNLDA